MAIKNLFKRNVVLLAALAIIVGTSAFKTRYATDTYAYTYTGSNPFSQANLETESNWVIAGTPRASDCGEESEVNCSIELPQNLNSGSQLDASKAQVHVSAISGFNQVSSVTNPANDDEIDFEPELGRQP